MIGVNEDKLKDTRVFLVHEYVINSIRLNFLVIYKNV